MARTDNPKPGGGLKGSSDLPSPPPTLFHYTTVSGFIGILRSKSVWATDARFLNDATELSYGFKYFEAEVERLCSDERWLRELSKMVLAGPFPRTPCIATMSYCAQGDLLSQWRGYSGNAGFAIGVDTTACYAILRKLGVRIPFMPVSYSDEAALRFARAGAKRLVSEWRSSNFHKDLVGPKMIGEQIPDEIHDKYVEEIARISYGGSSGGRFLSAYVKDPAFAEEQEWRTVVRATREEIEFRDGKTGLTPYVSINLCDDSGLLPITQVVVGPGRDQELRVEATQMFLEKLGYGDRVTVSPSKVPYR